MSGNNPGPTPAPEILVAPTTAANGKAAAPTLTRKTAGAGKKAKKKAAARANPPKEPATAPAMRAAPTTPATLQTPPATRAAPTPPLGKGHHLLVGLTADTPPAGTTWTLEETRVWLQAVANTAQHAYKLPGSLTVTAEPNKG